MSHFDQRRAEMSGGSRYRASPPRHARATYLMPPKCLPCPRLPRAAGCTHFCGPALPTGLRSTKRGSRPARHSPHFERDQSPVSPRRPGRCPCSYHPPCTRRLVGRRVFHPRTRQHRHEQATVHVHGRKHEPA